MATFSFESRKRPCYVKDQKALFHMWCQISWIVNPSMMVGGHNGGVVQDVYGLVELEDGTMMRCEVYDIKFIDNEFDEYDWSKK